MSDNEKNLDTEAVETPVEEAPAEETASAGTTAALCLGFLAALISKGRPK